MEEKKKSSKEKTVVIVILILIILGLAGYIVYDKDLLGLKEKAASEEQKEDNSETQEEQGTALSVTDTTVTDLMNQMNISTTTDTKKMDGYFYRKGNCTSSEVDNYIKLYLGMKYIEKHEYNGNLENGTKIERETMSNAIKSIFGPTATYTDASATDACPGATYDNASQTYTVVSGCGGTLIPYYEKEVVKAVQYSDRIEIEEKALYAVPEMSDETSEVQLKLYTADQETLLDTLSSEEKDILTKYQDKLSTYKYTFKEEDGKYYFDSVELMQ